MADKQYVGAVTVKRRTGIVNYWAYYRDTAGKQRLRSLKTNNLKEALARAKKINDSLTSGTDERLDTVRRNRATTFASVMEAYLKVTTWSPSTLDRNLFRIKLINDRWGDVPVAQITPHDIGLYLQELVESRSIATRNRYLAVLRKVFGYAFDNALIPTNPTDGLKQLKEPERIPSPHRRSVWSDHECITPLCTDHHGYPTRYRHAGRRVAQPAVAPYPLGPTPDRDRRRQEQRIALDTNDGLRLHHVR